MPDPERIVLCLHFRKLVRWNAGDLLPPMPLGAKAGSA